MRTLAIDVHDRRVLPLGGRGRPCARRAEQATRNRAEKPPGLRPPARSSGMILFRSVSSKRSVTAVACARGLQYRRAASRLALAVTPCLVRHTRVVGGLARNHRAFQVHSEKESQIVHRLTRGHKAFHRPSLGRIGSPARGRNPYRQSSTRSRRPRPLHLIYSIYKRKRAKARTATRSSAKGRLTRTWCS